MYISLNVFISWRFSAKPVENVNKQKIINILENSIVKYFFSFYILIIFMVKKLFLFILYEFYEYAQSKNIIV